MPRTPAAAQDLISEREAARRLRVSRTTFARIVAAGGVRRHTYPGCKPRYVASDVEALVAAVPRASPARRLA